MDTKKFNKVEWATIGEIVDFLRQEGLRSTAAKKLEGLGLKRYSPALKPE